MTSSNTKSEDGAPPGNDPAKHTFIQRIITRLSELRNRLSQTKKAFDQVTKEKGSTETPVPDKEDHGDKPSTEGDDGSQKKGGDKDGAKSRTESDENKKKGEIDQLVQNQLDKACKELDDIISAFHKVDKFEKDMSEPLDTLENNVNDIQADLKEEALTDMVKKIIERNLKVLGRNIAKVKMQIPSQKVSATVSDNARRYLQTTVSSKVVGLLPNPYEAKEIFESSSFVKEFRDHYKGLGHGLKLCLLCFAILPEDAEVKKRLLKFWWVGERLIPEPGDSKKKSQEKQSICSDNQQQETRQGQKKKQQPKRSDNQQQETKQEQKEEQQPKNQQQDTKQEEKEDQQQPKSSETQQQGKEQQPKSSDNLQQQEKKLGKFLDETLEQFIKKGFIEPVTKESKSPPTSYKMHPIIRSLIIKFAKEANFFDYDSKGNPTMNISASKKSCLVKPDQGTSYWFSKSFSQTSTKQWLKEELKRIRMEKQRLKGLDKLQTLFNVSKRIPDFPVKLFSKMRNIGVLYLGRWESTAKFRMEVKNTAYLKGLENFKKLRFFSLQGISGISVLPDSLCQLTNLRILDLRACHSLVELPERIGLLKKLTHLDLSECYLLDKIPKSLFTLPQLKILKGFVISKNSPCSLDDLAELPMLEKLSINVNEDSFSINKEGVVFSKFKALKKLKIAWGSGGEGAKSKFEKNGENKKSESDAPKKRGLCDRMLNLKPWGGTKPGSKQNEKAQEIGLTKLVKLDLQCFPEREPPNWLLPQNLTSLERLYIKGGELSNLGESLMQEDNKKKPDWKVKTLRLKFLTNIKTSWEQLRTQFPNLDYLEKVNCPQITFCPCDANGVWIEKKQQQP